MIDWPRIVIELRKWGTTKEIAKIVGVCDSRLVEICAGYEWTPRFDQGMKLLSLYDRVAGQTETGRAVDRFKVWAVASHQSLKQTSRARKRLSSDRGDDIQPVSGRAIRGEGQGRPDYQAMERDIDQLISELERGEGSL